MGLFNKLLDGLGVDSQAVGDLVNGLIDNAKEQTAKREAASYASDPVQSYASGDSWGEMMPEEENQYNFGGTYIQYFENIFDTEFSEYRYDREDIAGTQRTFYTFYAGGTKVLMLELMNEGSSAQKIRNTAWKENVPYLRFYYDHDGWWNTRSYVVRRMKEAIR